jgi:hypothetical protein
VGAQLDNSKKSVGLYSLSMNVCKIRCKLLSNYVYKIFVAVPM